MDDARDIDKDVEVGGYVRADGVVPSAAFSRRPRTGDRAEGA